MSTMLDIQDILAMHEVLMDRDTNESRDKLLTLLKEQAEQRETEANTIRWMISKLTG